MPERMLAHIEEMMEQTLSELKSFREDIAEELAAERQAREDAIRAEQRKRHRGWAIGGMITVAVVVALIGAFALINEVMDNNASVTRVVARLDAQAEIDANQTCEARRGIRKAMGILVEELAAGREDDPVIQKRIANFNAQLAEALPLTNCD